MTYLTSTRVNILGRTLPVAFAVAAIALVSARAHAAEPDQFDPVQLDPITVSAPATAKIVDRDSATGAPIEQVTITARVQADPAALKTNYGALMLNYSVLDAARKACTAADPFTDDDGTCVRDAVESAKPQVDAAIARARSSLTG
jgi:hypothetical protein